MHAEMVLILLVSLVVSQLVLVFWKTRHFKSFQVINFIFNWLSLFKIKFVSQIYFMLIQPKIGTPNYLSLYYLV